jgi:hypothetical protein
VTFFFSNTGHHLAMLVPVARLLSTAARRTCHFVSLCELRGIETPTEELSDQGFGVQALMPFFPRRTSSLGKQGRSRLALLVRRAARRFVWLGRLAGAVESSLSPPPRLVVLPNDVAFPYDCIAGVLRRRGIRFVLQQEGIRFPCPWADGSAPYGTGGAVAIAAWGEGSARFFELQGIPRGRISLTGSPRFDSLSAVDWIAAGERLRGRLALPKRTLLLLSNPIDDQGFCSTREKIDLLRRFAVSIAPLLGHGGLALIIKLHGREDRAALETALGSLVTGQRVRVLQDVPLYPLFSVAKAAIVIASSVGLEALLFRLPLGVLETPHSGFAHDYVSGGAAIPLSPGEALVPKVSALLGGAATGAGAVEAYLNHHLECRSNSAERVAALVDELAVD